MFKMLIAEVDGRLAVGIVPVTTQLGLKAIACALRGRKRWHLRTPLSEQPG